MRSNVILAVFKRNVASYFSGMLGYLFIVVFVIAGAFAAFNARFFANNLANLDQLSYWYPYLLLFLIPAITMTTWADEKKMGTDELLFTLPASDFEIIIGKYLAALAVYTTTLLFSLSHVAVLAYYGDPDLGVIFATYVGYWLAGAALLACGMFASVLTGSVTVAFVLGVVFCAIPVFIDQLPFPGDALRGLSVRERLAEFSLGLISLKGVLYFLSLTAFMLYLNAVMIARRHWAGGQQGTNMGMQFLLRALSLAAVLISANYMVGQASGGIDMTSERVFTLSQTTKDIVSAMDGSRPVTIEAFLSPEQEVPQQYVGIRKKLVGLLRSLDSMGGSRVQVRYVDVEPFSTEAEAAERWGIVPQTVTVEEAGGKYVRKSIFLGTVTKSGFDQVVTPFYGVGDAVEYELARSLGTVSQGERLTVGILETDARVMGGFNMQSFSSDPAWRIVSELKKQYIVKSVSADQPIEEEVDVLLAVLPSSLTDPQLRNLVDYVQAGHPTLIFDDPFPATYGSGVNMAPLMPKPPRGGGMMGMQQPSEEKAFGGRLTSLLDTLDLVWEPGTVLFDLFNPHPEFPDVPPELVWIHPASGTAFNDKSPVTSGLKEMLMFLPGHLQKRGDSNMNFTALLWSGEEKSGVLTWDQITRPGIFGGRDLSRNPPRIPDAEAHVMAMHIQSKDPGGVNVIFVADTDVVSNESFRLREDTFLNLPIDNVVFVLNAVDVLASESRFTDLRTRRPEQRILTVVQEQKDRYTKQRSEREIEARDKASEQLDAVRAAGRRCRGDREGHTAGPHDEAAAAVQCRAESDAAIGTGAAPDRPGAGC